MAWLRTFAYHIFRTVSRDFFRKFCGSGLYNGATYVRMFSKSTRYTLQPSTASVVVTAAVDLPVCRQRASDFQQ